MKRHRSEVADWRRFELLVSRIERALQPAGCVVRSPDHLLDVETNELREVDCSIVFPAHLGGSRISIECRKRGAKQDVTWIEQLATKRTALNLERTIAVSSRGFSKAAYLKAKHHGITLNTYREVARRIADRPLAINHTRATGTLRDFKYEVPDDCPIPSPEVRSLVDARFSSASNTTAILRIIGTEDVMTFGQVLNALIAKSPQVQEGCTLRKFKVTFPAPTTFIDFPDSVYLESLRIELDVLVTKKRVDESIFGTYLSRDEILLEVARATFELDGKEYKLELLFQVEDLPAPASLPPTTMQPG